MKQVEDSERCEKMVKDMWKRVGDKKGGGSGI